MQDVHWLRAWRMAHTEAWEAYPGPLPPIDWPPLVREMASLFRSDLTLVISDYERELLQSPPFLLPADRLSTSASFFYDSPPSGAPGWAGRRHFCMLGNARHPPNRDAVHYAAKHLWPQIRRRLPDAELHVYGAYTDAALEALADPATGLLVKGFTRDAHAMLRKYRLLLAPLRAGAGIKGKISDAWYSGCPTVTTPIGSEGMTAGDGSFGGFVARNEPDLVVGAAKLYNDQVLWQEAVEIGRRTLRARFDFETNAGLLDAALKAALDRRAYDRGSDLVSSMLWYHGNRSDEYFSRWVELKESQKAGQAAPAGEALPAPRTADAADGGEEVER